ncbi:MAG TPA: hypothetical protein VM345_03510 [Acidimicrobiales bacterium]|jgi:hypothetical protein|nr:hypothetical protein [Acidimicrobiales bacterium]
MATPQQPEIRRSERTDVVPDHTDLGGPKDMKGETGPVPEANEPGHRPEKDQDKPTEVPDAYRAD